MTNLAETVLDASAAPGAALYLGPARVMASGRRDVKVRLSDGQRVDAQLALALPYEPMEGDVVLVLGKPDEPHYIVGVLHGSGTTALSFRGDVKLRAIGGSLDLEADEGVRVRGREVHLEGKEISMTAGSLVQRFKDVYQRVRGLLDVRAQETRTVVDGATFAKSKSATILTEGTVTINGEQIHLG